VIRNGINVQVIGTGIVIVLEGFEITDANIDEFTERRPLSIRNMRVHFLASGDEYTIPQLNPPHK